MDPKKDACPMCGSESERLPNTPGAMCLKCALLGLAEVAEIEVGGIRSISDGEQAGAFLRDAARMQGADKMGGAR